MSPRPRILFIDAHDSFSNNITSLLTTLLDVDVTVLPIGGPSSSLSSSASSSLSSTSSPADLSALLRAELTGCAAVVCGPGPGSPDHEDDVGIMRLVWDLPEADLVPVLGICLGFQSLVSHPGGGGRVRRLRRGLHGVVRDILHVGLDGNEAEGGKMDVNRTEEEGYQRQEKRDVFAGVGPFKATLYHSLGADIGQDDVPAEEWSSSRWRPLPQCPDIVPLAWVEESRGGVEDNDGLDASVERILMAARHRTRPFWGLQYHPESVCTEAEGNRVVMNWFAEAMRWNRQRGRMLTPGNGVVARAATRPSLLSRVSLTPLQGQPPPTPPSTGGEPHPGEIPKPDGWTRGCWKSCAVGLSFDSVTLTLPDHVRVPDIVETLCGRESQVIVLDSTNAHLPAPAEGVADVRGRYSIIAPDVQEALRIEYHTGDAYATVKIPEAAHSEVKMVEEVPLDSYKGIWGFLASFQDQRRAEMPTNVETPFMGGFMGYITYEQGLQDIGIQLPDDRGHHRPDISLVWVTRSIVVDHRKGLLHVQQLTNRSKPSKTSEDLWAANTAVRLEQSCLWLNQPCPQSNPGVPGATLVVGGIHKAPLSPSAVEPHIVTPDAVKYEHKVRACQEFIAAGDSYELCLTDQTKITRPWSDPRPTKRECVERRLNHGKNRTSIRDLGSWQLFKGLRERQPAPFASYLRLGAATLVSASPERFLRHDGPGGICSMRPMKGTVRKSPAVPTLQHAEELLHVPKEIAENLMIVDLVRHDMHGVCGAGNVSVPHLMRVEEYQSVFQMITVVEGRLPLLQAPPSPPPSDQEKKKNGVTNGGAIGQAWRRTHYTGLDVLAASLPPGSMTGAPKKRSCEILRQIEGGQERSLYSGVVGYMCASGRGDWSVTIRSMFRWDDRAAECDSMGGGEVEVEPPETWHIGAGGAVTILSTPEGEREEMFTKLAGPLGIFTDGV